MRFAVFILVLLAIMWSALAWAVVAGDRSATHQPHPARFAVDAKGQPIVAMLVGEASAANDRNIAAPGFLFGSTLIILLTVCILLSAEEANHRVLLQTSVVAIGTIFLAAFAYMFWVWNQGPSSAFLGPFPEATTLMLLAVAIVPALFGVVYVVGYSLWFTVVDDKQRSTGQPSAGKPK